MQRTEKEALNMLNYNVTILWQQSHVISIVLVVQGCYLNSYIIDESREV